MELQEKKHYNAVFWVEVDKIRPNPYQPRREFDEGKLRELASSIRQYGVLQPLVVTRHEETRPDGGIQVFYELIAGERRTRAAKLAGVHQVPVLIREGDATEASARLKLELAIIENLQREDLSPVERARAFKQLSDEFGFKHSEIAQKIGKSREYVTNTIRILGLPAEMITALEEKKISEGHARPLLMLADKKEEQDTLFKDILYKRLNVREAEATARAIAVDRARKPLHPNPEFTRIEREFAERLGTRVRVEPREKGGKIVISFFSDEDLQGILDSFEARKERGGFPAPPRSGGEEAPFAENDDGAVPLQMPSVNGAGEEPQFLTAAADAPKENDDEDDLYSIKSFTV